MFQSALDPYPHITSARFLKFGEAEALTGASALAAVGK